MIAIHNTEDWPHERLSAYGKDITAAMRRLAERFPKDVTLESLASDVIAGKQQLWLILDGEQFLSFVMSEMKTNTATGHRHVTVTSMAGEDGVDSAPLIQDIETWAKEHGADEIRVVGRYGWKRPLGSLGYEMDAALFRKDLN